MLDDIIDIVTRRMRCRTYYESMWLLLTIGLTLASITISIINGIRVEQKIRKLENDLGI